MIILAKETMQPLTVRLPRDIRAKIKSVVEEERGRDNKISDADVIRSAILFFFEENITNSNDDRGESR